MSVWVTISAEVKDGEFNDLQKFLQENLQNVRGFAGALSVAVNYDRENGAFLIVEEWLSRKHHGDYIASISDNGVLNQLAAFFNEAPEIRYYERLVL